MPNQVEQIECFELVMHGIQAMRRHVERLACPIQGGSGVRAHYYPHQIQNVQRILAATRIRHLIADEVGMGKTVQALMVASALRLQRGRLRVRVVVGRSELQSQWSEEICRAHQVIWDKAESVFGDDWFEVISETNITAYADTFNASSFDLLIIDEPQSLKIDTIRFVSEHSHEFASLLLLTASPNLRNVERFCELLQILEPDRIERARREVDGEGSHKDTSWSKSRLRDLEESKLMEVSRRFEERCARVSDGLIDTTYQPEGVSPIYDKIPAHRRAQLLSDLSWRYRRVLRSYREDYPDHLPKRLTHSFERIEPTDSESKRSFLALNYAKKYLTDETDRSFIFLRRSTVCSEAFQSQLRSHRQVNDRGIAQIDELAKLSSRSTADARLDFLVDWLVDFWRRDSNREVLIAAQDNATVDELEKEIGWRIPLIGPRDERKPLQIATARDIQSSMSADENADATESEALRSLSLSQLREFQMGGKQLLIATDSFRQSFNLQSADALVFYSLPWNPEDVDQWIGRVDRLGRGFVSPEERKSPPKPIHIITIHRFGDPSVLVEQVFNDHRILKNAIDLERELLESIRRELANAVFLGLPETTEAPQSARTRREVTPPTGSRWSVENAVSTHRSLTYGDAMEPQLRHTKALGFVSNAQEQCLASWIWLLNEHGQIVTRKVSKRFSGNSRRNTIYTLSQLGLSGVTLESLEDHRKPFPAFFIARRNVHSPPRLRVVTGLDQNGKQREVLLQFLSHGSELHEEIVKAFLDDGRVTVPFGITLLALGARYFPNGTTLKSGTYMCGAGFIDSANAYNDLPLTDIFLQWITKDSGVRRQEMREGQFIHFRAGIEADQRFVRMTVPTKSCCLAFQSDGRPCTQRDASDLLTANWSIAERPNTQNAVVSERLRDGLPMHFRIAIASEMKSNWAQSLVSIQDYFRERVEMIRVEAFDTAWNLRAAIEETQLQIKTLVDEATTKSMQTVQLVYKPRLDSLNEELKIVWSAAEFRCDLLHKTISHVENPLPETVDLQATVVVNLQADPEPIQLVVPVDAANVSDLGISDEVKTATDSAGFRTKPR
jgi:ATP-dependent helicase HepA